MNVSILEVFRTKYWDLGADDLHAMRDALLSVIGQTSKEEMQKQRGYFCSATKGFSDRLYVEDAEWVGRLQPDDQLINVVNVCGPITRGGGACTYGSIDHYHQVEFANSLKQTIGHIFLINTPGGSSEARLDYTQAIQESRAMGKPCVAFIDGICCSAGMFIASQCDLVIVRNAKNNVGCIGTMAAFYTLKDGAVNAITQEQYVEITADESPDKNLWYRKACEGDYTMVKEDLRKLTEEFKGTVRKGRPNVTEDMLTGKVYPADEVLGKLVDEVGNWQSAIDAIFGLIEDPSRSRYGVKDAASEEPEGDPDEKPEGDPDEKPEGDPDEKPEGDPDEKPEGDPDEKPEENSEGGSVSGGSAAAEEAAAKPAAEPEGGTSAAAEEAAAAEPAAEEAAAAKPEDGASAAAEEAAAAEPAAEPEDGTSAAAEEAAAAEPAAEEAANAEPAAKPEDGTSAAAEEAAAKPEGESEATQEAIAAAVAQAVKEARQSFMETIEALKTEHQAAIATMEQSVTELSENIDSLKAANEELTTKLAATEGKLTEAKAAIKERDDEIKQLSEAGTEAPAGAVPDSNGQGFTVNDPRSANNVIKPNMSAKEAREAAEQRMRQLRSKVFGG